LKTKLSTFIIDYHPNETLSDVCSKIRPLKPKFLREVDNEKQKFFSPFSNREEENKKIILKSPMSYSTHLKIKRTG